MLGKVHGCDTMSGHFSAVNTILVCKNVGSESYLTITQNDNVDKSDRADTGREHTALYKPCDHCITHVLCPVECVDCSSALCFCRPKCAYMHMVINDQIAE